MYKQKNKDKAPKVKNTKRASVIYIFFVYIFLASGGDSPLYPEILHNDPAAHQDHCFFNCIGTVIFIHVVLVVSRRV